MYTYSSYSKPETRKNPEPLVSGYKCSQCPGRVETQMYDIDAAAQSWQEADGEPVDLEAEASGSFDVSLKRLADLRAAKDSEATRDSAVAEDPEATKDSATNVAEDPEATKHSAVAEDPDATKDSATNVAEDSQATKDSAVAEDSQATKDSEVAKSRGVQLARVQSFAERAQSYDKKVGGFGIFGT